MLFGVFFSPESFNLYRVRPSFYVLLSVDSLRLLNFQIYRTENWCSEVE